MNPRIRELAQKADCGYTGEDDGDLGHALLGNEAIEKFAKLIVRECIDVAKQQHNPAALNYKPSERFVEALQQHFGVEE